MFASEADAEPEADEGAATSFSNRAFSIFSTFLARLLFLLLCRVWLGSSPVAETRAAVVSLDTLPLVERGIAHGSVCLPWWFGSWVCWLDVSDEGLGERNWRAETRILFVCILSYSHRAVPVVQGLLLSRR